MIYFHYLIKMIDIVNILNFIKIFILFAVKLNINY